MKIWRIKIRYAELAVKLKPLAIQGEARLRGREQTMYVSTAKTHRRDAGDAEISINRSLRLLRRCGDMTFLQQTHVLYSKTIRRPSRGEDVLPDPDALSVGVLTRQRVGRGDGAAAFGQVLLMQALHAPEMLPEGGDGALRSTVIRSWSPLLSRTIMAQ